MGTGVEGEDLPGLLQPGKEVTTALSVRLTAISLPQRKLGPHLDLAGNGNLSLKNND